MSFIKGLNKQVMGDGPISKKAITMEDIALCKGSGNFAVRALNVLHLGVTKGKWVTDAKVEKFMAEHFDKLDIISDTFRQYATPKDAASKDFSAQKQSDAKIAIALSKVFERASSELLKNIEAPGTKIKVIGQVEPNKKKLETFKESVTRSLVDGMTLKHKGKNMRAGIKNLERYSDNPMQLLRATLYENQSSNDIKGKFYEFLKNYDGEVKTEKDVKNAYQAFMKDTITYGSSWGGMESLKKDRSLQNYEQFRASSDKLSTQEVLKDLGVEKEGKLVELKAGKFNPVKKVENRIQGEFSHEKTMKALLDAEENISRMNFGPKHLQGAKEDPEYAKKLHLTESINFLNEMGNLRQMTSEGKQKEKMLQIIERFVQPDADELINIPFQMSKSIFENSGVKQREAKQGLL